jgi:hypothetical protein
VISRVSGCGGGHLFSDWPGAVLASPAGGGVAPAGAGGAVRGRRLRGLRRGDAAQRLALRDLARLPGCTVLAHGFEVELLDRVLEGEAGPFQAAPRLVLFAGLNLFVQESLEKVAIR